MQTTSNGNNNSYENFENNLRTNKKDTMLETNANMADYQYKFHFDNFEDMQGFLSPNDWTIKKIEKLFGIKIECDYDNLTLNFLGNSAKTVQASQFIKQLSENYTFYKGVDRDVFESSLNAFANNGILSIDNSRIRIPAKDFPIREVKAKSPGQDKYMCSMRNYDMTFGVGGAGTGKTYLAVAMGLEYLLNQSVDKLILCRPAVTAGKDMGAFPGDPFEKVDPYLQPCFDAIEEIIGKNEMMKRMNDGQIVVQVLELARGVTWKNAFVIIDEAQNTTPIQMKLVTTRPGCNCKLVINGDPDQIDIKGPSGLIDFVNRFKLASVQKPNLDSDDIKQEFNDISKYINVVLFSNADTTRSCVVAAVDNMYRLSEKLLKQEKEAEYDRNLERYADNF